MQDSTKYFTLSLLAIVFGGLILQFLTPLDLAPIYHFIVNIIVPFLFIRVELPIWKIIYIFLAGPLIIILLRLLYLRRTHSSRLIYTSDKIYGLLWNWDEWRGAIPHSQALTPRCPKFWCKCQLQPKKDYEGVTFYCQHCGFKKKFPLSFDALLTVVDREIDRRIVTRAYRFKLIKKPFRILLNLARLIFKWPLQRLKKSSR